MKLQTLQSSTNIKYINMVFSRVKVYNVCNVCNYYTKTNFNIV